MSLPVASDLGTLDFWSNGQPFTDMEAYNATSGSLDFWFQGQPFIAAAGTGTPTPGPTFNATQFMIMMG